VGVGEGGAIRVRVTKKPVFLVSVTLIATITENLKNIKFNI
jgi:hypothetical protein